LRAASGLDVPEDLKDFIKESDPQPSQKPQKPADIAFAWHWQKQAAKKLELYTIKRLGNEDAEDDIPERMNIQYYRSVATSHLKHQYCMFVLSFFERFAMLTYFSGTDRH